MDDKSFYECLEIERHATAEDIRKAYRRLAAQWHPDKCKTANATEIFKMISEAYEVLSDEKSRKEYDTHTKILLHAPPHAEPTDIAEFTELVAGTFEKTCRCGEKYVIKKDELDEGYTIVQCSGCSLFVDVKSHGIYDA